MSGLKKILSLPGLYKMIVKNVTYISLHKFQKGKRIYSVDIKIKVKKRFELDVCGI